MKDPINQAAKAREGEEKWKKEEKKALEEIKRKETIERLEKEKAIQQWALDDAIKWRQE